MFGKSSLLQPLQKVYKKQQRVHLKRTPNASHSVLWFELGLNVSFHALVKVGEKPQVPAHKATGPARAECRPMIGDQCLTVIVWSWIVVSNRKSFLLQEFFYATLPDLLLPHHHNLTTDVLGSFYKDFWWLWVSDLEHRVISEWWGSAHWNYMFPLCQTNTNRSLERQVHRNSFKRVVKRTSAVLCNGASRGVQTAPMCKILLSTWTWTLWQCEMGRLVFFSVKART